MSLHKATLIWERKTPDFQYDTYDRTHVIQFEGGQKIQASSAPAYLGKAELVNPEEQFVAALSSCHMLTFLAIAAKSKLTLDAYEDHAEGHLEKGPDGKLSMTRVTLNPKVKFSGTSPSPEKIRDMHDKAHHNCFIANSVKTQVDVIFRI